MDFNVTFGDGSGSSAAWGFEDFTGSGFDSSGGYGYSNKSGSDYLIQRQSIGPSSEKNSGSDCGELNCQGYGVDNDVSSEENTGFVAGVGPGWKIKLNNKGKKNDRLYKR